MDIIIINWLGPFYSIDEVKYINYLKNGLYAFFGIKRYSKNDDTMLQYVGKTKNTFYERWYSHSKPREIRDNFSAWFGIIKNKRKYMLNKIEHHFIRFCNPYLNVKCIKNLPNTKMLFISEFYKKDALNGCDNTNNIDENKKYTKLPTYVRYIPNFIMWDGELLRISKNIKTFSKEDLCLNIR